jgi:uncharacterized membrane protein
MVVNRYGRLDSKANDPKHSGRDADSRKSETDDSPPRGGGADAMADAGRFEDPVADLPGFHQTESFIAIAGHPLHAMSVAFPIALTFCTFGADLFYWWTGDSFWARAALWAGAMAFLIGIAAAAIGTLELLTVPGIRARAAAWTHAAIAVLLLSVLGTNWGFRLYSYEDAVLPYGILLSAFSVVMVAATGWHGGRLVFDYHLGTSDSGN